MKYIFYILLVCTGFSPECIYAQNLIPDPVAGQTEILIADDNFNSQKHMLVEIDPVTKNRIFIWQQADATGSVNKNIHCAIYTSGMSLVTSFIVNKTTIGDQMLPALQVHPANGSFIVAWASWINSGTTSDPASYDIYAKKIRFANTATDAAVNDLLINSNYTTGMQSYPAIALDVIQNEIVVGWLDQTGQDRLPTVVASDNGSYARRVNMAGTALALISGANQFLLNTVTTGHQNLTFLKISPLTGELYTLCGAQGYAGGNDYDIIMRRFSRDVGGQYIAGAELIVNTYVTGSQHNGYITFNPVNGNYAVSFSSQTQDGSGFGAYTCIYSSLNVKLKEGIIHQSPQNNQLIPKAFWDEATGTLCYFYWYSSAGEGTLVKGQIFDSNYNFYGPQINVINKNLKSDYGALYTVCYDQISKKALVAFDEYSGTNTSTKAWFSQFTLSMPIQLNTSNMNAVETYTVLQAGQKDEFAVKAASENIISLSVDYFDGLGRLKQQVQKKASPLKKDMVQPIEYDVYGRQVKQYLLYTATTADGSYQNNALSAQSAFYSNNTGSNADKIVNDANPYVFTVFDNSPLNIPVKTYPQGVNWQTGSTDHSIKKSYRTNAANEVRIWDYDFISATATGTAFYPAGTLSVTEMTDEDNNKVREYKDKLDRIVLLQEVNLTESEVLETYHVYDEYNNLRFEIPPVAVDSLSFVNYVVGYTGAFNNRWLFTYKFDARKRMTEKKVPGVVPVYYVYDKYDRIVMIQDGNNRSSNMWQYLKYDNQNRVVIKGIYTHGSALTQATMQSLVNANTTPLHEKRQSATTHGYSNQAWPTTNTEILSLLYYDDYDMDYNGTADHSYSVQGLVGEAAVSAATKGLITCQQVKILSSSNWIRTVIFYDLYQRPVQKQSNNHLVVIVLADITTIVYDFTGNVLQVKETHNPGTGALSTITRQIYDHMKRPSGTTHKINSGAEVVINQLKYNELGENIEKNLHVENAGSTSLQSLDYAYNIRGWLTHMNNAQLTNDGVVNNDANDLFGMQLFYETAGGMANTPLFNGNISAVSWKGANALTSTTQRSYKYTYDGADRLKSALMGEYNGTAWVFGGSFDEKNITYDKNGNIKALQRTAGGAAVMDNLTYTYNGNLLTKVQDAGSVTDGFKDGTGPTTEYTYDANGSTVSDANKNMAVSYNLLNLAQTVQMGGSSANRIEYTYSADGIKLKKKVYVSNVLQTTTDYIGGYVYENNVVLEGPTPEGRIVWNGSSWLYQYHLTDHLGNVRMTFDKNPVGGAARIIQEDHYYAYGMLIPSAQMSYRSGVGANEFLLQGNEFENELGLNLTSFELRMYDAALARWLAADPYDQYQSPYVGMGNNPLNLTDPSGGSTNDWYEDNETHEVTWFEGSGARQGYTHLGGWGAAYGDANSGFQDPSKGGGMFNRRKHLNDFYEKSGGNYFPTDERGGMEVVADWESWGEVSGAYGISYATGRADPDFETSLMVGGALTTGSRLLSTSLMRNFGSKGAIEAAKTGIQTANGIEIAGFAKHGLNRTIERGVKPNAILNAVKNPLKIGQVSTDAAGRQSQRFIGQFAEVVLNPQTGKIISTNPTSSKQASS